MSFWNFIKSLFEPGPPRRPFVAPAPPPLFTTETVVTTVKVEPVKPKAKKAPVKKTKAPKKKPVAKKAPKKK